MGVARSRRQVEDAELAYALLRFTLGVNLLVHGGQRLLTGVEAFVAGMLKGFANTPLPAWAVSTFGWTLPFLEAALGLLLVLGLFTRPALVVGSLLMAALMFGMGLRAEWSVVGDQLVYAFVLFALLFLRRHNRLSLDAVLLARRPQEQPPKAR
jgi:thiosulfate dehydrogenase (quinone) large subunit